MNGGWTKNIRHWWKPLKNTEINKDIACVFWIGRINIVKMPTLPKATYSPNAILTKIPKAFVTERGKTLLNLCGTTKTLNSQANTRKKQKSGGFTHTDFKLYKSIVIQTE